MPPTENREYVVRTLYLGYPEGEKHRTWITEEDMVTGTYYAAGQKACEKARAMDEAHGDDHFWTVTLTGEHGDYFQLFHGRLS